MTKHLHTVEQVITELGGAAEVWKLVKRNRSGMTAATYAALCRHRGRFPSKTFKALNDALQARGAAAPDKLWGMS